MKKHVLAIILSLNSVATLAEGQTQYVYEQAPEVPQPTIFPDPPTGTLGGDTSRANREPSSDPGPDNLDDALAEGMRRGAGLGNEDAAYARGLRDGLAEGLRRGYDIGKNEGALETFGELTDETPGPTKIPNSNFKDLGLGLGQ